LKPLSSQPWLAPLLWAGVGFAVYFHFAQFIVTVSWNAIELIIAQHLLDHGVYALSVDFPSALTWRPPLPTLVVTGLRAITDDPILIYQLFCGATAASLAASLLLCARTLWGAGAGHLAAFLALSCPAITTTLISQPHSYSHLGALLFLGPALFLGIRLLRKLEEGPPPWTDYLSAGIAWGLCFLCRSELLLFWACLLALAAWQHWRKRRRGWPLVALVAGFAAFYFPYNLYADRVAARDGLLARKAIYGFYAGQGWVDPAPGAGPDVEAEGYSYAQQLYGSPLERNESLVRAIAHNPSAFLRRVRLNSLRFYAEYARGDFVPAWLTLLAASLLVLLGTGRVPAADRRPILFLLGLVAASHFVLIFHIDRRYLTINVAPLLLLTTGAVFYALAPLRHHHRGWRWAIGGVLGVALGLATASPLRELLPQRPRNDASQQAFRALGTHFRSTVPRYRSWANREPHLMFVPPARSPVFPEDQFLLAYYSRTAWYNGDADGAFPRGRIYSYRNCPLDFLYVPAECIQDGALLGNGKIVGECDNPVLGRYYLVQVGIDVGS
jgi:hypothetical protein